MDSHKIVDAIIYIYNKQWGAEVCHGGPENIDTCNKAA